MNICTFSIILKYYLILFRECSQKKTFVGKFFGKCLFFLFFYEKKYLLTVVGLQNVGICLLMLSLCLALRMGGLPGV